jgi:hypothetical protein
MQVCKSFGFAVAALLVALVSSCASQPTYVNKPAFDDFSNRIRLCGETRELYDTFLPFMVGCVLPAWDSYFAAVDAPEYLVDSIHNSHLQVAAKIDAGEMTQDEGEKLLYGSWEIAMSVTQGLPLSEASNTTSSNIATTSSNSAPVIIIPQQQGPSLSEMILMQQATQGLPSSRGSGLRNCTKMVGNLLEEQAIPGGTVMQFRGFCPPGWY